MNGLLDCTADSEPFHDVNMAVAVFSPHVGGVTSAARGPPSKWTFMCENGICGLSSNVVVSWPVMGSGSTLPGSLITTPGPLATR